MGIAVKDKASEEVSRDHQGLAPQNDSGRPQLGGRATMPLGLKVQARPFYKPTGHSTFDRDAQTSVTVPSSALFIVQDTPPLVMCSSVRLRNARIR